MILIVCVDDAGGLSFNGRRQSQDRALRARLLEKWGRLWMNAYSAKQFSGEAEGNIRVDEDFLEKAGEGEACFAEGPEAAAHLESAEKVVLYRWNRKYPSDCRFPLDLTERGWRLEETAEFAGSSHEKITEEVYAQ